MRLRKIAGGVFAATIFAVCAWYLYSHFSWAAGISIFRSADLRWLIGGVGLFFFGYLLVRSLRWQIMIRDKGSKSRFLATYFITTIALGLGMISPAQSGEALKVELTKRYGDLSRWPGAGAFVAERIIDLVVLGAIALAGLVAYGPIVRTQGWIFIFAIIAVVATLVLVFFAFTRDTFGRAGIVSKFREASPAPFTLVKVGALSIVSWALVASCWKAALMSVGINLSVAQSVWLVAVVAITQFASLIPGGIGAADVVTAELLQIWGYDQEKALAGAIALRAMGLFMICITLLHWAAWAWLGSKAGLRSAASGQRS
jgi:uncharacterized membrane protein YbhN (UPF0104 family)